jgi:hypothetical protein
MLDHVFTDAIGALRDAVEDAMLERQAFEERFQVDMLLGDMTWETSYGLPGEGTPPRIRADITLEWPTWSQSAYRSWYIGEEADDSPRIQVGIVLQVQHLASLPDLGKLLDALPPESPKIGGEPLVRSSPAVHSVYGIDINDDPELAVEVSYEGEYELDEAVLADGSTLDDHFSAMGGWISSTLVRVGDLEFDFLPPDDDSFEEA